VQTMPWNGKGAQRNMRFEGDPTMWAIPPPPNMEEVK